MADPIPRARADHMVPQWRSSDGLGGAAVLAAGAGLAELVSHGVLPGAPLFRQICVSKREEILHIMSSRKIQTNEVGRSALLGPALSWVAQDTAQPLQLVDVGCSAGLNLLCDRYLLDYAAHGSTGPEDAAVRIACRVISGRPPIEPRLPSISWRVGIDRDPPDLTDPSDALWQLACVWPDTGRLARTRSAIAFAERNPPVVVRGNALEVLPEVLSEIARDGIACITTTWVFAYFSLEERREFVEMLSEIGSHRPVVWIAGEGAGIVDLVQPGELPDHSYGEANVLSAVTFDDSGTHSSLLGFTHPHGLWLDWRA